MFISVDDTYFISVHVTYLFISVDNTCFISVDDTYFISVDVTYLFISVDNTYLLISAPAQSRSEIQ